MDELNEFREEILNAQCENLDNLMNEAGLNDEDFSEQIDIKTMELLLNNEQANAFIAVLKQVEAIAFIAGFITLSDYLEYILNTAKDKMYDDIDDEFED